MNEDPRLSPLGEEMVAGLSAFCDAIESGESIEKRFTVRTITLDLQSKPYEAEDVKRVRNMLRASQALLAKFLGVSVKAVRSWEQGTRRVPTIACRFMDEIVADPELWKRRIGQSTSTNNRKTVGS
jgi:putative transcriptional regulator